MTSTDRFNAARAADLAVLRDYALPYNQAAIDQTAAETADNLAARHAQLTATVGRDAADLLRAEAVLTNLRATTLAIAHGHAACRRKNCKVCDQIRIALVELIAYRSIT
jgi:hypothetical protein